ncbi:Uncharacterised protein [Vibrio cholerae]|nr:Uncharacterised protein [Vibrio cholerae]
MTSRPKWRCAVHALTRLEQSLLSLRHVARHYDHNRVSPPHALENGHSRLVRFAAIPPRSCPSRVPIPDLALVH